MSSKPRSSKSTPKVDIHAGLQDCSKTFAHDGKLRRDHEATHNPLVIIDDPTLTMLTVDFQIHEDKRDDMLAYQKALLEYGMLILNFWDAISTGDGARILWVRQRGHMV